MAPTSVWQPRNFYEEFCACNKEQRIRQIEAEYPTQIESLKAEMKQERNRRESGVLRLKNLDEFQLHWLNLQGFTVIRGNTTTAIAIPACLPVGMHARIGGGEQTTWYLVVY